MTILKTLEEKNLIHDCSNKDELEKSLENSSLSFYCGFDPTADSLHVGSLLPLVMIKRLIKAGHKAYILLGAATAMIGDPSGKSEERNLIDQNTIEENLIAVKNQIQSILTETKDNNKAEFVRNDSWIAKLSAVELLRDIGKHFSVNAMIARDSVKSRLETREQGISFTEFSYMLIQAYDFYYLHNENKVQLQIGGSDQWGNISSGLELIRKKSNNSEKDKTECFGLTFPLITTSSGTKFGKTEKGNVWLSKNKTSPFEFYQFWLNAADEDVLKYLDYFCDIDPTTKNSLIKSLKEAPEKREAQKFIANELTELVHGKKELEIAIEKTNSLFQKKDISELSIEEIDNLYGNLKAELEVEAKSIESGLSIQDLVVRSGLASSKGQARKAIEGGGIYLNDQRIDNFSQEIRIEDFLNDSFLILRSGKKKRLKIGLKT